MLIYFSIIAVHGLGSVPARAWVHKESKQNWLKDFLPDDLAHKARIMVYNHQSHWGSYAFTKKFDAFAGDLLRALEDRRSSNEVCTSSSPMSRLDSITLCSTRTKRAFDSSRLILCPVLDHMIKVLFLIL